MEILPDLFCYLAGSFLLTPPLIYMQNIKRRYVLTQAQVNFSQSDTSSLLHGGRGANRKDPRSILTIEFVTILTIDLVEITSFAN